MSVDLKHGFEVDECGRPVVFGRSAGAYWGGYSYGPGAGDDAERLGSGFFNYVVLAEHGLIYMESGWDNGSDCDMQDSKVIPLTGIETPGGVLAPEEIAVNMLYSAADASFEQAVDLGITDEEIEAGSEENEKTIANLKADLRREIEEVE